MCDHDDIDFWDQTGLEFAQVVSANEICRVCPECGKTVPVE